ncbi:hypothetical protein H4Q26_016220, partial [Puccinia striiformis f. sp. tritici PST-130]
MTTNHSSISAMMYAIERLRMRGWQPVRRPQKNNWCGEVSGPTSDLERKDAGRCLDPTQVVDCDPDPIEGLSKPWWTQNLNAGPEELEPRLILNCGAVKLELERGEHSNPLEYQTQSQDLARPHASL